MVAERAVPGARGRRGRSGGALAGSAGGTNQAVGGDRRSVTAQRCEVRSARPFRPDWRVGPDPIYRGRRDRVCHSDCGVSMRFDDSFGEGRPEASSGPLDPFFGDPDDPAALLDAIEPAPPLTDDERADVLADLA